ncbi:MAG: glycosyltransferase, partial [Tannerella sp.]|nr:glycosyltransferase [Tannerella sp.]
MRKKKVLMLATSRNTRGGISAVLKLYESCPFWQRFKVRWIETHTDTSIWGKFLPAMRAFVLFLFFAPSYPIIHIHLSEPPSMLRKFPFFIYARLLRRKIVLHFHSFSPRTTVDGRFRAFYRYLFARADKVIVLSDSWRQRIEDSFGLQENITVIPNPCPDVPDDSPLVEKQDLILFAGLLIPRKGYADLIRAFQIVAAEAPAWKLVLAGSGETEEAARLAGELGIAERVVLPG